jgi:hypothetical protein
MISSRVVFLLFLAILLFVEEASWMTEAALVFDPFLSCEMRQFSDGTSANICADREAGTPSPAEIDNEIVYIGGYVYTFNFYEGLPEGTDTTDPTLNATPWLTVTIDRDDDDKCNVTVGEVICNTCAYCSNNDGYSADCTNVAAVGDDYVGVEVTCMVRAPVYFPLDKPAEGSSTQAPAVSPMTEANINNNDGGSSSMAATSKKGKTTHIMFMMAGVGMSLIFLC